MVENTDMIKVRNFTDQRIVYLIPEMNCRRDFSGFETKEVPAEELRALWFKSGGKNILTNYLGVDNQELAEEFEITEDEFTHEYSWTNKDIDRVLTSGSIDELADALDYAPIGIIETLVSRAVALRIPDMNKRKLIKEMTNKDITKMITYTEFLEEDISEEAPVQRRRRTEANTNETPVNAGRRAK